MNFLYRSFGEQVLNNATRCKFGFTNASDFIDGAEFKDSLSGRCRHGTYFFPGVNRRTGMGVGITLDEWSEIEHCSNKKIFFVAVSFSSRMSSRTFINE